MLDKLEMRSNQTIDLDHILRLFPKSRIKQIPTTIYKRSLLIDIEEAPIVLHTQPIWTNAAPLKIVANPSKWSSFNNFKSTLSQLTDIDSLEITRIDHAIDLNMSIQQIHESIKIKHKTRYATFKENAFMRGPFLTGFYLGSEPEIYCIYDKGYELGTRKGKFKRNKSFDTGLLTRIELRQFRKKIKYKTLKELLLYQSDSPFKDLEFYEPNYNSEKAGALKTLFNEDGFHFASKKLNQHGNFNRNNRKSLNITDLTSTINSNYQNNLCHFFEGK